MGLTDLASSFYSLEKMSFGYLRLQNPVIIQSVLQNSQTLKVLDLYQCQPSLQTIEKIIKNCNQLTEVSFTYTQLCEESIDFICNNLTPSILKLSLSHLKIRDDNIRTLVKRC